MKNARHINFPVWQGVEDAREGRGRGGHKQFSRCGAGCAPRNSPEVVLGSSGGRRKQEAIVSLADVVERSPACVKDAGAGRWYTV